MARSGHKTEVLAPNRHTSYAYVLRTYIRIYVFAMFKICVYGEKGTTLYITHAYAFVSLYVYLALWPFSGLLPFFPSLKLSMILLFCCLSTH